MNEKTYRVLFVATIVCFVAILLIQSIVDSAAYRRANTQIYTLERELATSRERVENCTRELEDCRGTVGECYESVGRIADNFREQSDELQGIINSLVTVRVEVEKMENALHYFYDRYGPDDYNNNNITEEIEND